MKNRKTAYKQKKYPIDSGGIIHMASLKKGYANTFRIAVTMKDIVDEDVLQKAFNDIRGRFPTIVAGITKGVFDYRIVPVNNNIDIEYDNEILKPLTFRQIKACAMKVLYRDNIIAIEIFHSLTDGTGGAVFLRTLIARYISLKYGEDIKYSEDILNHMDSVKNSEISDDYVLNAGTERLKANKDIVYKILGGPKENNEFKVISNKINTDRLLEKAHSYNTSLTTYLTTAMVDVIFKVQDNDIEKGRYIKNDDIQIMVPINLRKKFNSNTLCNFTLFALPKYNKEDKNKTFEELVKKTALELQKQFNVEELKNRMAINAYTQNSWMIKYMPLIIKEKIFRIVYKMYGERNSCISVSNFGEISFSNNIDKYISDVEFVLTPRRNAAYNCSLISYNGCTTVSISRKGEGCGLEDMYFELIS